MENDKVHPMRWGVVGEIPTYSANRRACSKPPKCPLVAIQGTQMGKLETN